MNIALLIESLAGGGSERVVYRLALGLAARRHGVFVYCLRTADAPLTPLRQAGVCVREARSYRRDCRLPWRLACWLRRDRVQIVHAHSCAALVAAFAPAKLLRIPLMHVWHGWPLDRPTRAHRLAELLTRFVDCVGVNSESLRAKLPKLRPTRAAVNLPNGIDLEPQPAAEARARLEQLCGRPLDGPVVLSVGNVRPEKDVCGLLAAVARLRRQMPTVRLVHVGGVRNAAYWQRVRETCHVLGLDGCVHFGGAYDDAWRLMAGADVFCLSSRTESLPNVVLEAMSQRTPIVATAVGDVGTLGAGFPAGRPLLRHNQSALLAPPGDPGALAEALACALRDPDAARARAARAWADYRQYFTLPRMVRRYERTYERCRAAPFRPRGVKTARPEGRGSADAAVRKPSVLMLGPAPPSVGGMVTSINLLMGSSLRERYTLHRLATTTRTPARGATGHGTPPGPLTLVAAVMRHIAALVRLAAVIVGRRIDLVHIHTCSYVTFYRNVLDLAAAKLLRRAVVLHIRGGYFAHFCARAGRWRRRLIRWALEAADAVIVLSPGWRERLRPFTGHARVLVVPNGVELASVTQGRPAGNGDGRGCRFLYLSPLTEAKGLGDLLDAARQLNRDGVPFHLVIAGPAPGGPGQRAAWQRRVEGAALTEMITFAGAVGGEAKARLFAQADCFVHPSHAEGLPNTILEAAAAGLPVIATAVGGVPELMLCRAARPEGRGSASARDPGAPGPLSPLVPPHDPTSLAREMKRLACDAALRQRTAAALRARVAGHYSVSRVADRVGRVYRAVLALRRGRQRCPERCLPQGKRFRTPFPAAKCGRSVEQVETARIGAP